MHMPCIVDVYRNQVQCCIFLTALCIIDAVLEIYCIRIVDYSFETL